MNLSPTTFQVLGFFHRMVLILFFCCVTGKSIYREPLGDEIQQVVANFRFPQSCGDILLSFLFSQSSVCSVIILDSDSRFWFLDSAGFSICLTKPLISGS